MIHCLHGYEVAEIESRWQRAKQTKKLSGNPMPHEHISEMDVRRLHTAGTTQRHVPWEAEVEMIFESSPTAPRVIISAVLTFSQIRADSSSLANMREMSHWATLGA